MSDKDINKVIKLFENNKYILENEEKIDLKYRIKTKSYHLYKLIIEFLLENNIKINYKNVSNFIKLEIKIRNDVRNLITVFEEGIWNKYILHLEKDNSKTIDLKKISENINLNQIINILNETNFHIIRNIRNDVSHLTYFITFKKIKKLISNLQELKNINFISEKIIDKLLYKLMEHQKELGFKNIKFY